LIDEEINFLSKILFILMLFFAGTIVVLNGFHGNWGLMFFRFVLLLCSIIPISLRVNLDLAKIWYSYSIDKDKEITETITRNSSIPEELGRIEVLFTDKTGTLTQNDMVMKKICLEFMTFSSETLGEVKEMLQKTTGPF
jgi:phospholipid-translocating ATPase